MPRRATILPHSEHVVAYFSEWYNCDNNLLDEMEDEIREHHERGAPGRGPHTASVEEEQVYLG